jgi:hypothetical protein
VGVKWRRVVLSLDDLHLHHASAREGADGGDIERTHADWDFIVTKGKRILLMIVGPLIVLGIVAALVFSHRYGSGSQTDRRIDEKELQTASAVLARHEAELMSAPGVVGVGLGLTEKGDRPAIHVFLNVKATGGTIPPAIPKQIENVPVRIIETDEIKAR